MRSTYTVQIEKFQGPLDLLLQLIEQQELDITEISLASITDEFITHLDQVEDRYPEELADFLVIATKLLYIKSRALLPFLTPEEEESAGQLAQRLKMYKEFRDAAERLVETIQQGNFMMTRKAIPKQLQVVEFSPPQHVTPQRLAMVYQRVVERMTTVIRIPKAAIRKAITLKERITALSELLQQHQQLKFSELVIVAPDRSDIVVTFLAILELVKQDMVTVQQPTYQADIVITKI